MNKKLLEIDIKALLINHLINHDGLDKSVSIINEFTLDNLSRRADLITIDNSKIIGYEIKSEADSLYRLEGQVEKYLEYFDKVVIIVASKHVDATLQLVPSNVGVWEVRNNEFLIKQRGKVEKNQNKEKLINLLKSNELLKLSKKLNIDISAKNRKHLQEKLLQSSINNLREAVLTSISSRYLSTNLKFWDEVKNRSVSPQDIIHLSHYIEERKNEKSNKINQQKLWNEWENKLKKDPKVKKLYKLNQTLITA